MLRLKMWDNGILIAIATCFRSLVLIPSKSILFFGSSSLIMLMITEGEVALNSSDGGFGFGGMKSSGSSVVE
jgi:hypothetical protein